VRSTSTGGAALDSECDAEHTAARGQLGYRQDSTGERMFSEWQQKKEPINWPVVLIALSGVAALLDTIMGSIINLGLDHSRSVDNVIGISFTLGFPCYLLAFGSRSDLRFYFCHCFWLDGQSSVLLARLLVFSFL
jgi:hypothetical protein